LWKSLVKSSPTVGHFKIPSESSFTSPFLTTFALKDFGYVSMGGMEGYVSMGGMSFMGGLSSMGGMRSMREMEGMGVHVNGFSNANHAYY
jgi:hypothetical protein